MIIMFQTCKDRIPYPSRPKTVQERQPESSKYPKTPFFKPEETPNRQQLDTLRTTREGEASVTIQPYEIKLPPLW